MNKKILFGFLILAIFISGCGNQEAIIGNAVKENGEFFCKSPYIEYQKGACCLDSNNNGVCDEDDVKAKEVNEVTAEEAKEIVPEECPFECPENRVCMPVYTDEKLTRWACA